MSHVQDHPYRVDGCHACEEQLRRDLAMPAWAYYSHEPGAWVLIAMWLSGVAIVIATGAPWGYAAFCVFIALVIERATREAA